MLDIRFFETAIAALGIFFLACFYEVKRVQRKLTIKELFTVTLVMAIVIAMLSRMLQR